VVLRVVLVAGFLEQRVEVTSVLLVEVRRGEIRSAAEPPCLGLAVRVLRVLDLEVAVVEVNCRGVRVSRVNDEGATSDEVGELAHAIPPVEAFRSHLLDGCYGEGRLDDGDVAAGLLEGNAVLQDSTVTEALRGVAEVVGRLKLLAGRLEGLERGADGGLKGFDVVDHSEAHRDGRIVEVDGVGGLRRECVSVFWGLERKKENGEGAYNERRTAVRLLQHGLLLIALQRVERLGERKVSLF
jgi:hypothetical protein